MVEGKKKCPACGGEIWAEATVCEYCGANLSASPNAQPPIPELYNPTAAVNWSLLFSPIFGAYVMMENWKTLGLKQRENRSRNWLIGLIAVPILCIIAQIILNGSGSRIIGPWGLALVIWYLIEGRAQIKYLATNKICYRKKSWKSIVVKALGILALWFIVMFVIGMLFGEPTLDYSSPKAYRESCEEILEYLGGDLKDKDAEDWTEDDRETFAQIVVLVNFLQHEHSKELREQIDGMSANELLDFVTENYSIGL